MLNTKKLFFMVLALIAALKPAKCKLSDTRACADPQCNELIGVGKTLLKYHASDSSMLSFNNNREVKIFSKGSGTNPDLWGVMIDGRRGYVNKNHIQEQRILTKHLPHIVSVQPNEQIVADINQPASTQETVQTSSEIETTEKKPDDIPQTKPHLGDHAKQVTLSPEDMEYNRIKSSYANTAGEFVLEGGKSIPVVATPALDIAINPTEAINTNIEVIDGTTIYLDGGPSDVVTSQQEAIDPTKTVAPKTATFVPEIQSSVDISDNKESTGQNVEVEGSNPTGPVDDKPPPIPVQVPSTAAVPSTIENVEVTSSKVGTPSTIANIDATPDQIVTHEKPEEISKTEDMQPSKVVVEANADKVGLDEEENLEDIDEDTNDQDEVHNDDEDDEEEEEEEDDEDKDRKEDIQEHINNLKKSYSDQAEEEEPNKNPEEKLTGQQQHEKIIENIQNQVSNEELLSRTEEPVPTVSQPAESQTPTLPEIPATSAESSVLTGKQQHEKIIENIQNQVLTDKSTGEPVPTDERTEEPMPVEALPTEAPPSEEPVTTIQLPEDPPTGPPVAAVHHPEDSLTQTFSTEAPPSSTEEYVAALPTEAPQLAEQTSTEMPATSAEPVEVPSPTLEVSKPSEVQILDIESTGEPNTLSDQEPVKPETEKAEDGFFSGWFGTNEEKTEPSANIENSHLEQNEKQNSEVVAEIKQEDKNEQPENIENTSGEIKFHMPGDTVGTPVPIRNSGEDITFHTPSDFVDIGEGQQPSLIFQHKEPEPFIPQEQVIRDQQESPNQNQNQAQGEPSFVQTQEDSQQHYHQDPNQSQPSADYQDGGLKDENSVGDAINAGDEIKSVQEIEVSPDARTVDVNFHDENDLIVEKSVENTKTLPKDDVSGEVDSSIPSEGVSSQIPPITIGEEATESYVEWFMQFVPSWLHSQTHDTTHNVGIGEVSGDLILLLVIVAVTLLIIYIINQCIGKISREKPLIAKISELDKKLFTAKNELLITKEELVNNVSTDCDSILLELGNAKEELELCRLQLKKAQEEKVSIKDNQNTNHHNYVELQKNNEDLLIKLEYAKTEEQAAVEKAKEAEEMLQEMGRHMNEGTKSNQASENLLKMVEQLQQQLETQKTVLETYEPKYRAKDKLAKDLHKKNKQMKVDVANAELSKQQLENELSESTKMMATVKNEVEEWKSLSDLLQSQLNEKNVSADTLEKEVAMLKTVIKSSKLSLEEKEEQVEELQERWNELETRSKKSNGGGESENGWDDGDISQGDHVMVEDLNTAKEIAEVTVKLKRAVEAKKAIEVQTVEMEDRVVELEKKNLVLEEESTRDKILRDEEQKRREDIERKLEMQTEFYIKKETELQKQLGLQSAQYGDVSKDAESKAMIFASTVSELGITKDGLKAIKREMSEQETSFKAAIAVQEKSAHDNWIAVKASERKLNDLQIEASTLRKRLTTVEGKNVLLEQINQDLETSNQSLHETKSEIDMRRENNQMNGMVINGVFTPYKNHGADDSMDRGSNSSQYGRSTDPGLPLPPLPGQDINPSMPGLGPLGVGMLPAMMPPMFPHTLMDTRIPPLGRMSPGPRDRYPQTPRTYRRQNSERPITSSPSDHGSNYGGSNYGQ